MSPSSIHLTFLLCLISTVVLMVGGDFFPADQVSGKILSGPPKRPSSSSYYPSSGSGIGGLDQSQSGSNTGNNPNYQNHPSISSVDMQLLTAIEKLVSRMDKLDARVKTLESVVYFLTNKQKPEQGSCPKNFTQIDGIKGKCYYVSSLSNPNSLHDWKSSATECAKVGGRLAELATFDDFYRISQFLNKFGQTNHRVVPATDYWTGGLNPGLIWIWSDSAQQVDLDRRFWNDNDNSSKAPGCLKLSYSVRLVSYFFKGSPCSQPQNFICEILDNKVARALKTFEQELIEQQHNSSSLSTSQQNI